MPYLLAEEKPVAEMIPDRLPRKASAGEDRMFNILKKLPDDHLVYYEPAVGDRYPDFIVLLPDIGLLVIEVKGWYRNHILEANDSVVTIRGDNGVTSEQKHPVRQARDYMLRLMDECQGRPEFGLLLQDNGRFKFPFSHLAVLSKIESRQLGDLSKLFSSPRMIFRDVLLGWERESFNFKKLRKDIKSRFDPFWEFGKLNSEEIDLLRAIIHPESIFQKPSIIRKLPVEEALEPSPPLSVLDIRQERSVRGIGDGHRLIFGVAGSGKTVLLISRARLLAAQKPEASILVLCFNRMLANFLRDSLREFQNISVWNFHKWAQDQGVPFRRSDNEVDDTGAKLLVQLENGQGDARKYDAILIDEAQDFEPVWFQCVREALKEPNDGDLLIVGDGHQGLYNKQHKISWISLGINAQGRTITQKFDLDRNYRNTRQILELASVFADFPSDSRDEDGVLCVKVDPSKAVRQGIHPVLVRCATHDRESARVVELVQDLLGGRWCGHEIERPLQPREIGILYPRIPDSERRDSLSKLLENLGKVAQTIWLSEDRRSRDRVGEDGLKVQTIKSVKGLQYRAVIVIWADLLPHRDPERAIGDRRETYVALTRPEDFLAVTATGTSKFIDEMIESGKVEVIG